MIVRAGMGMPMAVMVMVVVMAMIVMMMIVMVMMRMMIMMVVAMAMTMVVSVMAVIVTAGAIRPAFRLERRRHRADIAAKPRHHFLQHVIAGDAQLAAEQFGWNMAIAQMPGDADERRPVLRRDFDDLLRRGDHFDLAAILKDQGGSVRNGHRLGQIEEEFKPALAFHGEAAAAAILVRQNDAVGRIAVKMGMDGGGAQHGRPLG